MLKPVSGLIARIRGRVRVPHLRLFHRLRSHRSTTAALAGKAIILAICRSGVELDVGSRLYHEPGTVEPDLHLNHDSDFDDDDHTSGPVDSHSRRGCRGNRCLRTR